MGQEPLLTMPLGIVLGTMMVIVIDYRHLIIRYWPFKRK